MNVVCVALVALLALAACDKGQRHPASISFSFHAGEIDADVDGVR